MQAFANFTIAMYGTGFGSGCFYDTTCLKNDDKRWFDTRSWRWQKCSQLAYFQVYYNARIKLFYICFIYIMNNLL